MKLVELQLTGVALQVATDLVARFPVTFTSGRRTVHEQADAMAADIISSGLGADWIIQTYVPSYARGACFAAVYDLTMPLALDAVKQALCNVLSHMTDADLFRLSHHLGGCAFDLRPEPLAVWWGACMAWLGDECRAKKGKLLQREGVLVRTHAEFPPVIA